MEPIPRWRLSLLNHHYTVTLPENVILALHNLRIRLIIVNKVLKIKNIRLHTFLNQVWERLMLKHIEITAMRNQ